MSAAIVNFANGILTIKLGGKLSHADLVKVQKTGADLIQAQGTIRILVLMEGFQGWEREGDWGDLSFMYDYDPFMKRMAMVGDEQWRDLALIFAGKGFRQCLVEYFRTEERAKAEAWLHEAS